MIYLYFFFLHLLADFILQPREIGKRKSETSVKGLMYLSIHISMILTVFFIGLIPFFSWQVVLEFAGYNALCHLIIDALIWKFYVLSVWKRRRKLLGRDKGSKKDIKNKLKTQFKYWEDYCFYLTIGVDQFLHFSTIVVLYEIGGIF
ncbi:MAG: DUF3307 domain-containing protein [Candidatus Njordarchaeales archaeon]